MKGANQGEGTELPKVGETKVDLLCSSAPSATDLRSTPGLGLVLGKQGESEI